MLTERIKEPFAHAALDEAESIFVFLLTILVEVFWNRKIVIGTELVIA